MLRHCGHKERLGLRREEEVNESIVIIAAPKRFGHIKEGGLSRKCVLREGHCTYTNVLT